MIIFLIGLENGLKKEYNFKKLETSPDICKDCPFYEDDFDGLGWCNKYGDNATLFLLEDCIKDKIEAGEINEIE